MESQSPQALLEQIRTIRDVVDQEGREIYRRWEPRLIDRGFRISALNLAHYLALRRRDLRQLQAALVPWGLSSLGRSEGRVMANLDAVVAALEAICSTERRNTPPRPPLRAFERGARLLDRQTRRVFGPAPTGRYCRIMVTFPAEAAHDAALVEALIERGMDCARINCAHEGPDEWRAMIAQVRAAEAKAGRRCRVLMDLPGPKCRTGEVVMPPGKKRVHLGERILLTYAAPREADDDYPNQAGCTLPEALAQVTVGERVLINDGKIGGRVVAKTADGVVMQVERAREKGERLRPEKGINLPDSELEVSPLGDDDRVALDVAAEAADIVGYSFVQRAEDVAALQDELRRRRTPSNTVAIAAKVETRLALRHLPELIVQAGGQGPFAVMIARGDLAVEIGHERLSEIQEEILWLSEAAHVPVVWATEVLQSFVKKGVASRAEFTDAAMAQRAECVMLNKGPYILEGVEALDNVLRRMQEHQSKKTAHLRALRSWQDLYWPEPGTRPALGSL